MMAGVICGVTIWSAHFTAMLGFMPKLNIRIDLPNAVGALTASVFFSTTGWLIAFGKGRRHGLICQSAPKSDPLSALNIAPPRVGGIRPEAPELIKECRRLRP